MARAAGKYDNAAGIAAVIAVTLPLYFFWLKQAARVWVTDGSGVSLLIHKLPEWDFTNLWAGGYLALRGQLGTLFVVPQYRAFLAEFFHATLAHHEWSYPPHMLLLGAPLALLPLFTAYLIWTIGSWALLLPLLRTQRLDWQCALVMLLSPAVLLNGMIGQNGCLVAFLLLGCLYWAEKRPTLAGILLGILTVKPQLGLIAVIALLATRNWRVLIIAALTASVMIVAATLCFGPEIWPLWLHNTLPFMRELMNGPPPQPGMMRAISPLYSLREIGLTLPLAQALQGLVTLACCITAWHLWRRADVPLPEKIALSVLLTLLSTPYAQLYDLVAAGFSAAILMQTPSNIRRLSLYLLWISPFFIEQWNRAGMPITPVIIAVVVILTFPRNKS